MKRATFISMKTYSSRVAAVVATFALLLIASSESWAQQRYSDPFSYCKAIKTSDGYDGRYTGPNPPPAVMAAWNSNSVNWRCVGVQWWGKWRSLHENVNQPSTFAEYYDLLHAVTE